MRPNFTIREALPGEFEALGQLMIDVYSQLPGFPGKQELPEYYEMLANIGMFTEKSGTKLVIALSPDGALWLWWQRNKYRKYLRNTSAGSTHQCQRTGYWQGADQGLYSVGKR